MLRIMSLPINIMKSLIGGNMEIWSLNEKKTDMMFNDKPVYMRSFIVDDSLSNGYQLTDTGDIDHLVFSVGTVVYTRNNYSYVFPYADTGSCVQPHIAPTNNIGLAITNTWHGLKCTIWYTKTTD